MKTSHIVILVACLTVLGAALIGCGNKAKELMGSPGAGTSNATADRPAGKLNVAWETNLCGHVLVGNCDMAPAPAPHVTVTATWKGGPTLSTTTDGQGGYCFYGIEATGFDVTVCVDPSTLPPGAVLVGTRYPSDEPNCQTVYLQSPNNVSDADFTYKVCGTPPPQGECTIPGTIHSNFNGTAVTGTSSGPAYIWFNSNISLKNMQAGGHVMLTNSSVLIDGVPHAVPNAVITFANVACASTSFDEATNTWNTTVPVAGSDEIFLSGLAFPVANLKGGAKVSWTGTFATDIAGTCMSWKWGAAAYKTWTLDAGSIDYDSANIKATHSNACAAANGDHAGTPENPMLKKGVTGGARGGGGSNFTGSWSATATLCPPCAAQ